MGYQKTLWVWFNKKSMMRIHVSKIRDGGIERTWILTKGRRGQIGHRERSFSTLGDLIDGLHEGELDSLIEAKDLCAMEILAMAADTGETV